MLIRILFTQENTPNCVEKVLATEIANNELLILPVTVNSEYNVHQIWSVLSLPVFKNKEIRLYSDMNEFPKLKDRNSYPFILEIGSDVDQFHKLLENNLIPKDTWFIFNTVKQYDLTKTVFPKFFGNPEVHCVILENHKTIIRKL